VSSASVEGPRRRSGRAPGPSPFDEKLRTQTRTVRRDRRIRVVGNEVPVVFLMKAGKLKICTGAQNVSPHSWIALHDASWNTRGRKLTPRHIHIAIYGLHRDAHPGGDVPFDCTGVATAVKPQSVERFLNMRCVGVPLFLFRSQTLCRLRRRSSREGWFTGQGWPLLPLTTGRAVNEQVWAPARGTSLPKRVLPETVRPCGIPMATA